MAQVLAIFLLALLLPLNTYKQSNVLKFVDYYFWQQIEKLIYSLQRKYAPIAMPLCLSISVLLVAVLYYQLFFVIGNMFGALFSFLLLCYCLTSTTIKSSRRSVLLDSHTDIFCLMFWFALSGPIGMWLYYQLNRLDNDSLLSNSSSKFIDLVLSVMRWIPSWITAMVYSLAGDFNPSYNKLVANWRDKETNYFHIIESSGQAALGNFLVMDEHQLAARARVIWTFVAVTIALVSCSIW